MWNGHSSLCLAKMSKFWVSLAMTAVPAAPGCSLLGFGSWNDFLLQPGTMNPWPVEGTNVFPKKMGGLECSTKSGRSSSSMCFKAVGNIASFFFLGKTAKHIDITFKLFVTHRSHPIVLHPLSSLRHKQCCAFFVAAVAIGPAVKQTDTVWAKKRRPEHVRLYKSLNRVFLQLKLTKKHWAWLARQCRLWDSNLDWLALPTQVWYINMYHVYIYMFVHASWTVKEYTSTCYGPSSKKIDAK